MFIPLNLDCSSDNRGSTWRTGESSSFDGHKSDPQFRGHFNRNRGSRGSNQEDRVNRDANCRDRSVVDNGNRVVSRHNESYGDSRNKEGGQGRGGRGGRRGGGRPPGLKGKDIGLYYRDLQKQKDSVVS